MLQLKNKKPAWTPFLYGVLFSVIPVVGFYLMEFLDRNPFEQIRPDAHYFNIAIYELLAWILFLILGRAKWALQLLLTGTLLFGLTNHYVMAFRSTPFVPWDFFSIKTAASVAAGYDFELPGRIIAITLGFVMMLILLHFWNFRLPELESLKVVFGRTLPAALCVVSLMVLADQLQNEDFQNRHHLYPYLFTPSVMVKYNGSAVTFTMDLAYLFVEKPEGYRPSHAEEILEEWEEDKSDEMTEEERREAYPNIIVIMDEAFSDLSVLGQLHTNMDYMPFVHMMQNHGANAITGLLNVSVCGGNTANSEYEFLTGNTMAFLPAGSIPYQQYIRETIPSLASYLKELGYQTFVQHPYRASGWNRDKVYPLMGFDHLTFINDYVYQKKIRQYVSDESDFQQIIHTFSEKEEGKPAFIFNVTMQNHGGYSDPLENPPFMVLANDLGNETLNRYLTLVSITDQQLENLINYFSQVNEKTVLVFFGDHQPNDAVAAPVLRANGMDYKNLTSEEQELRYQVPYLIWANFDIEEEQDADLSVNYLAAKVLEAAGIPLSPYHRFLQHLQENYPVISAVRREKTDNASEQLLEEYRELQYYRMFDYDDK